MSWRRCPAAFDQTDAEWLAWLRDNTALGYHTVGTCRMGGPNAVVDPTLKVTVPVALPGRPPARSVNLCPYVVGEGVTVTFTDVSWVTARFSVFDVDDRSFELPEYDATTVWGLPEILA